MPSSENLSPIELTSIPSAADPHGHLPWLRRLRRSLEDGVILSYEDQQYVVWKWYVCLLIVYTTFIAKFLQ